MRSIISRVCENAKRNPNGIAVSDFSHSLTYSELLNGAKGFAQYLKSNGFSHGERIIVEALPDVNYALVAMGIYLSGGVFVPVEKNISDSVVKNIIREAEAVLFIGNIKAEKIPCISYEKITEIISDTDVNSELTLPSETDIADILYTTGTTGKSKGVVHTHLSAFASSDNNAFADGLDADSVYLIASPVNHANGLRKLFSCFIAGSHAVLIDGFLDVKKYYDAMEKYRANFLLLPPSAVRFLLGVSRQKLSSMSEQIKTVHSGASAMSEADKDALKSCLPKSRLLFGYGASEAGNACVYDYARYAGLVNCVGKPNPHTRIKIVDENRNEIKSSAHNTGFVAISGETVMQGYLNDAEKTAEVLDGTTLYTNDIGYIDENGFLFVIGRRDDIINCGGLKIAPTEVENTVMQYGKILDCACFGIKDGIAGTAVKLNIVPEVAEDFDMIEFRTFLTENLEAHEIPKVIECVNEIPKTSNGKTDRKRLVSKGFIGNER